MSPFLWGPAKAHRTCITQAQPPNPPLSSQPGPRHGSPAATTKRFGIRTSPCDCPRHHCQIRAVREAAVRTKDRTLNQTQAGRQNRAQVEAQLRAKARARVRTQHGIEPRTQVRTRVEACVRMPDDTQDRTPIGTKSGTTHQTVPHMGVRIACPHPNQLTGQNIGRFPRLTAILPTGRIRRRRSAVTNTAPTLDSNEQLGAQLRPSRERTGARSTSKDDSVGGSLCQSSKAYPADCAGSCESGMASDVSGRLFQQLHPLLRHSAVVLERMEARPGCGCTARSTPANPTLTGLVALRR
jgi:hypothetical protein